MDVSALLLELFGRIPPIAREVVEGLPPERAIEPPRPGANTIAWLLWHLARVQDAEIAGVDGHDQLWVAGDWASRFGREPDPSDTGYGHTAEQVAGVRASDPGALVEYLDAVHDRTVGVLHGLTAADLDRVVDPSWDPPVTLGVRLVSIADDCLQHVGQAAYARGLLES